MIFIYKKGSKKLCSARSSQKKLFEYTQWTLSIYRNMASQKIPFIVFRTLALAGVLSRKKLSEERSIRYAK